mmetsp:Transcript_4453/g.3945  ORF Transcript_4453/g.3945 Transcript_4453/m.3945 type:complete len:530 (-) Transcript_4453:1161-2750(-)
MCAEDLDERDFQSRDLTVHKDSRQIKLHLETDVHVGAVDSGRPPEREATVGDLIQTRPLRIRELLVLHRLLEATCLLPEETLPCRKISAFKQSVLENALHTTQRLDDISAVVVEVPELAVMALVRPPEGVGLHKLVLLPVGADTPAFVVCQCVPILLEERIDTRDATIPRILEIFECETPVLRVGLLALERILGPHTLGVEKLTLPRLNVAVEIGNHLVLVMAQTRAEVSDATLRLLRESQITLRDKNVTHGEHAQATQLLRSVEDNRREPRRHFRVEADLDTRLNLVLALDQQVEQLRGVDDGLTEVSHQTDHGSVPLVGDFGEGGSAGRHEDLSNAILKLLVRLLVDTQVGLRCALLCRLVLQVPDAVPVAEVLVEHAALGQNAHLKPTHVEKKVGVVLAVDRHETVLPLDRSDGARQLVLDVPKDGAAQVHVVLHEAHASIARPALLVVVANHILVVGVGVLAEEALDEIFLLLMREFEHNVHTLNVSAVEPDRMLDLSRDRIKAQKVVRLHWRARQLTCTREAKH